MLYSISIFLQITDKNAVEQAIAVIVGGHVSIQQAHRAEMAPPLRPTAVLPPVDVRTQDVVKTSLLQRTPSNDHLLTNQASLSIQIYKDGRAFRKLATMRRSLRRRAKHEIDAAFRYSLHIATKSIASEEEKTQLRRLFLKLTALPKNRFDPKKIAGNRPLQRLLSPTLDALYRLEEMDPSLRQCEQHQLKVAIGRGKLAVELGCGIEASQNGRNGAQLIRALEGDLVGVFKPYSRTSGWNIIQIIKNFFGQARLLNRVYGAQEYAEVAAHNLNRAVLGDIQMTPAAAICQIRSRKGAFLAFLDGYEVAEKVIPDLEAKANYTALEIKLFGEMAGFNWLIGDMDSHDGNWFVRRDRDKNITKIVHIDHGNAFRRERQGRFGLNGNQAAHARLKIAKEEFSPEVREMFARMEKKNLVRFLAMYRRAGFLTDEMEKLLHERFIVMKVLVGKGLIKSPAELAKIKRHSDFQRLWKQFPGALQGLEDFAITLKEEDSNPDWLVVEYR